MIEIEELLRFIKDNFIHFAGNKIMPKVHPVKGDALKITADFILRKTTKTMKAVCDLCSKGYGEDAQVLGRTIFENAINLTFVCKPDFKETRDCLASLYILHSAKEQQNKQRGIEELKKKGKCKEWIEDLEKGKSSLDKQELMEGASTKEVLEAAEKCLKEYLRKLGKKPKDKRSWSSISLKDMSEIVGEPYECYYHFIYWSLSKLVHPSTLGSSSYHGVSHPSDEFGETGRALQISFDCYWRIVFMVDKIFELGFEEEINQVGQAVWELVENRLEKARSV